MFTLTPSQEVSIEEIDNQHREFVAIINRLYEATKEQEVASVINEILTDLVAYTKEHFATEEEYFKKFNYPDAAEHIEAHKKLTAEVENFLANKNNLDIYHLSFDLLDFLENWLIDHLENMDGKYAKYFKDHNLI